jgi:PHD/YefM family antitoxin component YafN of YafNO toxin-antitoxin module
MPIGMQYAGPYIEERVQHVGVSRLRHLNATNLRQINKTLVIQENDKPLAVLLSYEQFLMMQKQLMSVLETLELVTNGDESNPLLKGIEDFRHGRSTPLAEIPKEVGGKKTEK